MNRSIRRKAASWRRELARLLKKCFEPHELLRIIEQRFGPELRENMPSHVGLSEAELVGRVISTLENQGHLCELFFNVLIEERPKFTDQIQRVAKMRELAELNATNSKIRELETGIKEAGTELNEAKRSVLGATTALIVGAVLALGVLALNAWIGIQTSETLLALRTLRKDVEEVSARMKEGFSTRYVGEFPGHMRTLVEFVKKSNREDPEPLLIFADICSYGQFSRPRQFQKYKHAIIEASHKREVIVKIRSKEAAEDWGRSSAPDNSDFNAWIAKDKRWERYWRTRRNDSERPTTWEEFIQHLSEENEKCVEDLKDAHIVVERIDDPLPFFVWVDGKSRMFMSFYSGSQIGAKEVSFLTSDQMIIENMGDVARRAGSTGSAARVDSEQAHASSSTIEREERMCPGVEMDVLEHS